MVLPEKLIQFYHVYVCTLYDNNVIQYWIKDGLRCANMILQDTNMVLPSDANIILLKKNKHGVCKKYINILMTRNHWKPMNSNMVHKTYSGPYVSTWKDRTRTYRRRRSDGEEVGYRDHQCKPTDSTNIKTWFIKKRREDCWLY